MRRIFLVLKLSKFIEIVNREIRIRQRIFGLKSNAAVIKIICDAIQC